MCLVLAGPLLVNGAKVGYALTYRDIGERKQTEAKLQHDAMHDVLTGLPNRALFLDRLSLALFRRTRRRTQSCGVLYLDLDRFKEINDSLGHAAGDVLLVAVADRLRACCVRRIRRRGWAGDEFAVLVERHSHRHAIWTWWPSAFWGRWSGRSKSSATHIHAGASIGVAMAGPDHLVPESLIRDADFAMYRAKQEGGGRFEIFDKHLEVHVTSQQERERELRHGAGQAAVRDLVSAHLPAGERQAGGISNQLLRWRRADGSIDSSRDLLSVAEDTGLSISLGRETIGYGVQAVAELERRSCRSMALTLTINVTHRQFYHADLVAQLRKALAATGADPSRLMFEVAETTLNENPDAAVAILQRMVDCHVRVGGGQLRLPVWRRSTTWCACPSTW